MDVNEFLTSDKLIPAVKEMTDMTNCSIEAATNFVKLVRNDFQILKNNVDQRKVAAEKLRKIANEIECHVGNSNEIRHSVFAELSNCIHDFFDDDTFYS